MNLVKQAHAVDIQSKLFGAHKVSTYTTPDQPVTNFISAILPNIFVVASLLLLIYLIVGGFLFISSAGNTDQAQKGRQAATNAIIGFLIIFSSYWIIQIIQVITGVPILTGLN